MKRHKGNEKKSIADPRGGGVDPSEALACDICFAHRKGGETELVIITNEQWNSGGTRKYPASEWTPVGIVVIPGTHGVLKDGTGTVNQCGIMSLASMSCSTPETGVMNEYGMNWGGFRVDISNKSDELGRYDSVTDGLQNHTGLGYMPRQDTVNGIPLWMGTPNLENPYADTEMEISAERNPNYGVYGPTSDFKGVVNTKIITDMSTSQSDWRTSSTITHSYDTGYYPAACCCARFKTPGTKAFVECSTEELKNGTGFWYLPAAGELGYIPPRYADINDTIGKLIDTYSIGVNLGTASSNNYWSCSENSNYAVYRVNTHNGQMGSDYKSSQGFHYTRAFLRL